MSKLTCAIVTAGSLLMGSLATDTATATITGPPPDGSSPPDCSGAAAMTGVIWPPDHRMVAETVVGVTDPNGLAITVSVTGIQQDEPVNALGSGNTAPDANGVGTSTAYVRAERSGPGTGRIYFISFSASNSIGASCTGTVPVFVPHDQGQGFIPIDTGLKFDSTVVPAS
jgi:hypothetical protein